MSHVQLFRQDQFVFVDETGCKARITCADLDMLYVGKALFNLE